MYAKDPAAAVEFVTKYGEVCSLPAWDTLKMMKMAYGVYRVARSLPVWGGICR
jgi:hypothetical protein